MGLQGSRNTVFILSPQGLLLDSDGALCPDYWESILLLPPKPYHLLLVSPRTLMPSASLQFLFIWVSPIHTWHNVRSSRAEVLSILFHMSLKHLEQCPPHSRYPVIGPEGSCGNGIQRGIHSTERRPVHWRAQGYLELTVSVWKGDRPSSPYINTFLLIRVTVKGRRQHWKLPSCNVSDSKQDEVRSRVSGLYHRYRRN